MAWTTRDDLARAGGFAPANLISLIYPTCLRYSSPAIITRESVNLVRLAPAEEWTDRLAAHDNDSGCDEGVPNSTERNGRASYKKDSEDIGQYDEGKIRAGRLCSLARGRG